jgi:hypothetical protein
LISFVSAYSNWTEQTNAGQRDWSGIASSSDGSKLIASAYGDIMSSNGGLYVSNDSGVNWTLINSLSVDWSNVASSSDGNVLYAVSYSNGAWISTNGGINWNLITYDPFFTVATSSNGSIFALGTDGNQIILSNDFGNNLYVSNMSGSWSHLDISSDGTKMVAVDYDNDLWTSNDSGITWIEHNEFGSQYWVGVAISGDGNEIASATNNGTVLISKDFGNNWIVYADYPFIYLNGLAMSKDSSKIAVFQATGEIYISDDNGTTWIDQTEAGSRDWSNIAFSNDGKKIVAVGFNDTGGGIWTYDEQLPNCSSPTNPIVDLISYPYVDLNTTYQIKVSPFYVGVSNVKIQITDPNNSVSVYSLIYDNVSSYSRSFIFDTIGDYNFVIYGDNICPTILTNITGTLLVREPYYVTICGFNDKSGTVFKDNFAYLTAEFTNAKYNANLDQFITPLGFATTFKTPVFHTPYINGCGTLKLYESNASYVLRLFDGLATFQSEYSQPNLTKTYGTNILIGQNTFNGTSENLDVYLSAKDIKPYFWLMNIIFIIAVILVLIISIGLFFMMSDRPSFVFIFFIIGIIALIIGRIIIYFWIG